MRLHAPVLCVSRSVVASFIGILLSQATVHAQSVVNPTVLEFRASTDHAATVNGTPVMSRYDMGFYLVGAAQPFQVNPLGKPTPSNGVIQLPLSSVGSLPSPGITYEARITAVGPGGNGTSQPSNTFAFSAPCTFGVSPTTQSVAAGGGTGSVAVSTTAGCPWTATSNAGWITITSGSSGSANGAVGYSVAANTTTSARNGTLTIAGQAVTISQGGLSCAYTLGPSTQAVAAAGGTASVGVTTAAGCSWNATSSAGWLTITSGGNGSGSGSISLSAAANTQSASRSATVSVGGQSVTVNQSGACTFTVTPTSVNAERTGSTGTFTVTAGTGCSWTALSNASWISVTSGASGSGNGSVGYSVAASGTVSARTGTLTIAGRTVSITQAAVPAPTAPTGLRILQ